MESAGNIGSRRREGKKYAVEDEALDRIAKEKTEVLVKMSPRNNPLLLLNNEMDKFEALYLELYTHAATKRPPEFDVSDRRASFESKSSGAFETCNDYTLLESSSLKNKKEYVPTVGVCHEHEQWSSCEEGVDYYNSSTGQKGDSMTNLFVEGCCLEEILEKKTPQETWDFLTNISPIFNRMRYYLVS
ncbi:uncharacterized protein [Palaemon carinicauda]